MISDFTTRGLAMRRIAVAISGTDARRRPVRARIGPGRGCPSPAPACGATTRRAAGDAATYRFLIPEETP
jgi:hypothetical protein